MVHATQRNSGKCGQPLPVSSIGRSGLGAFRGVDLSHQFLLGRKPICAVKAILGGAALQADFVSAPGGLLPGGETRSHAEWRLPRCMLFEG